MQSPLSLSTNCRLVASIDASTIESRWLKELGIKWHRPHAIRHFQYWRDEETGLQFYTPDQVAGSAELYEQLQRFEWYYMEDKWEFTTALDILMPLKANSRVLEVGIGQGAFLEKARNARFQVVGMELNQAAAKTARSKGLKVIEKDLASLYADDPSPWDSICAFQVLEHLPEPRMFLDDAIALLRPGGLLILSVPNAAVARKLDPERNGLLDQPPHHMSHWDEEVFRSLENFLPLKLRHVAFEPLANYHINWFIEAWRRQLQGKAGKLVSKTGLNSFTISVIRKALQLGLRQLVRGHTLLVCLQKTDMSADGATLRIVQ